jgi:membrane protease YdiL (CAAX protease family)
VKCLTKKLPLYFIPGIIPMVLLVPFYFIGNSKVPSILVLIIFDLLITIPVMLYLIAKDQSLPLRFGIINTIFKQQHCVRFWTFTGIVIFSLVWAILAFQLMKPVSELILDSIFDWIPSWFRLQDYLLHTEQYGAETIKITFLFVIIASIIIPLAEEFYFRGFLMLKKEESSKQVVLRNTILFSAYHLWSPWLFFTRVIATYPIHYFVWKRKNIFLSITVHCTLNIVGDVVLIYPLILNL